MKTALLLVVGLLLSQSVFAKTAITSNAKGLDFAAPIVADKTQLTNLLPFGSIVYDKASSSFQGLDGTGSWVRVSDTPKSWIKYTTPSGYGSTDTKIRYFTSLEKNQGGSDISCASDSTHGTVCTINTDGVYEVSFDDNGSGATSFGISVNASSAELTTDIWSISDSHRVGMSGFAAGIQGSLTKSRPFSAGDVVRPHGGTANDTASYNSFSILRLK